MRAVCQRVSQGRVTVGGAPVGEIAKGFVVLLGIAAGDDAAHAERLASKIARLRVFEGDGGKFTHSLLDVGGEALVVSQFTLIADTTKGNRPSFSGAAPPDHAEPLYEHFCEALAAHGVRIARGIFGERMLVDIRNDGPVTIVLDTAP